MIPREHLKCPCNNFLLACLRVTANVWLRFERKWKEKPKCLSGKVYGFHVKHGYSLICTKPENSQSFAEIFPKYLRKRSRSLYSCFNCASRDFYPCLPPRKDNLKWAAEYMTDIRCSIFICSLPINAWLQFEITSLYM